MSRNSAVASSPPVTGTTRDCDLVIDTTTGIREAGTAYSTVRNLRTGVSGSGNQNIGLVKSGIAVAIKFGYPVAAVSSGLGNGAAIQYGIGIQTDITNAGFFPAAFSLRRGVTRIISTMFAEAAVVPNNDVGMQAVIGGATLVELLPVSGGGAGKIGFGIWMIDGAWIWATKNAADAAGQLSDKTPLLSNGNPLVVTAPTQAEIRIFDSAGGLPSATHNARVEIWLQSKLFLTRYWTNPDDVDTPVLPPLIAPVYPQIRNTSTGPANAYFGDFSLIHGPVNEGTL
jgi:hypothetical protein